MRIYIKKSRFGAGARRLVDQWGGTAQGGENDRELEGSWVVV